MNGAGEVERADEPPRARSRRRDALAHPSRAAAPPVLDPLLARWERFERRWRHIRPIRRGGVLGLERHPHRGRPIELSDGTRIRPGDPVGEIHLDNSRAGQFAAEGWLTAGWREGRRDLVALAAWARRQPAGTRPVAYCGTTVLAPIARRAGFEVRPRRSTAWTRLQDWYDRGLLRRWNPAGRARLARGHGRLRAAETWISDGELQRRYGEAAAATPAGDPDTPATPPSA